MSATAFGKAMATFWEGLGYPVYLAGAVPDRAAYLPCVVFEEHLSPFGSTSVCTATGWFRHQAGTNTNELRFQLLDKALRLIPEAGVKLSFEGGMAQLCRGSAEFLSLVTDPEDASLLGARVRLQVQLYLY